MLHVNSREKTIEHEHTCPLPVLKFFDRHATYCYTDKSRLKSFLASGAFFLGHEATERATTS